MKSDADRDVERIVNRTANRIAAEFDKMIADLPETAAGQMAVEEVVRKLTGLQPWSIDLIMEDPDIRCINSDLF